MTPIRKPLDEQARARIQQELRRDVALRQQGYRERALRVLPHVCARCGRELSGKRLRELTVHHRDHDHTHNPPDGSNWELLCIYCHDHEHEKYRMAGHEGGGKSQTIKTGGFNVFEGLDALVKPEPETGEDTP
jgi:hypothetical protein